METREIILIMVAIFGVFITILVMANPGVTLESGDWTTVSQNLSYFFVYLGVFAIVIFAINNSAIKPIKETNI